MIAALLRFLRSGPPDERWAMSLTLLEEMHYAIG